MRIDVITGNFIGAGEDATFEILKSLTGLPEANLRNSWPLSGIYRQVPITYLLQNDDMQNLAEHHRKSSVDILIMRSSSVIAVRVEGKKGDLKMQRQAVQARLLKNNNVTVVDLHKRECKELFKDRVNEKSIKEVKDAFRTAKVEIY